MGLLPLVNDGIRFSLIESIGEREDDEFVKTELEKISKENPIVAEFILRWTEENKLVEVAYCGIIVYQLLRSQAEVDKMNEELKLG